MCVYIYDVLLSQNTFSSMETFHSIVSDFCCSWLGGCNIPPFHTFCSTEFVKYKSFFCWIVNWVYGWENQIFEKYIKTTTKVQELCMCVCNRHIANTNLHILCCFTHLTWIPLERVFRPRFDRFELKHKFVCLGVAFNHVD